MLVQSITNLDNYHIKPCNTAKKHNTTAYATNTTVLPSFVDSKYYTNINFKALIHDYAREGYLEGVKRLLAKGEDLNIKDEDGLTPLHSASCFGGRFNVVEYLIEQGADLNIQSKEGWAPLHFACREGDLDTVKFLCEQEGIDLNIQKDDGRTPLHLACYNEQIDIVKYLCEQDKIDLTLKNNNGNMAVEEAKNIGYENTKWYNILKENTDYQLAHPETIGKSKPLSKEQEIEQLKKQLKRKQAKINKLKQELTQQNGAMILNIRTLLSNSDKLAGINKEYIESIVNALQDHNGKISIVGLSLMDDIFQSFENVTPDDLVNSIESVKNEKGDFDSEKYLAFVLLLTDKTAIKKIIKKR